MADLRTRKQRWRERRNERVLREYKKLREIKGAARLRINELLRRKYKISETTLYRIIKEDESGDLHNFEENENKTIIKN